MQLCPFNVVRKLNAILGGVNQDDTQKKACCKVDCHLFK